MGQLDNKVAVITGGSSGIGLAAAARFIDEGAVVYVTGRREQELVAAATKVGAIPVQGDATTPPRSARSTTSPASSPTTH